MQNLLKFEYNHMPVRTVSIDGQNWFVAKDICDLLGYQNPTDILQKFLETDEYSIYLIGHRETNVISESGLYALIFRSQKAEARPFRKWVTSEVLPTIRKTGSYHNPMHTSPIINELQAELLKANLMWANIFRYKQLCLTHVEIAKLVGLSTDRVRRHVRKMEQLALLVPAPDLQQKQRQAAHLIANNHRH
jgi:prophage antirepressor-like protein